MRFEEAKRAAAREEAKKAAALGEAKKSAALEEAKEAAAREEAKKAAALEESKKAPALEDANKAAAPRAPKKAGDEEKQESSENAKWAAVKLEPLGPEDEKTKREEFMVDFKETKTLVAVLFLNAYCAVFKDVA